MSLQVWLPLNGSMEQQGLSEITMTGSPVWDNAGKIGQCAIFSGAVANAIYNNTTDFNYTDNFSWAVWVNTNYTGTTAQYVFTQGRADAGGYGYGLQCTSTTNCSCRFGNSSWSVPVTGGQWTHLVFTKKGTTINIYKNGVLYNTYTFNGTLPTYSDGNGLGLGCFHYSSNIYPFYGKLNDFRIYDHCLSKKEVEEISKGLVLHYKLDNNGQGQYNLLKDTNKGNYQWLAPSGNGTGTVTSILIDGINCARYEMTVKSTNWCVFAFRPTNNAEVMNTLHEINSYTLSFDIFPSQPINNATPRYVDGNAQNNLINWPSFSAPANAWYHYEGTAISSGATQSNQSFYINYLFDIGTYDFKNLKIEIGTKATGYNVHIEESFLSNIIYDSSGYERNGKYIDNTCSFEIDSSRYNISTKFNGTTSGIIIQNQKIGTILSDICTISFWIKGQGDNGGRSVYFSSYSASPFWSLEKSTGNKLRYDWNGSPDQYSSDNILDEQWTHICLVRESSSSAKFYINGEYKQTFTSATAALTNLSDVWRIGRDVRSNDGTPYSGLMSDFRIYATALTAEQVKELYDTSATIDKDGNIYVREVIE